MRSLIRRNIPSMFHRRLALLSLAAIAVVLLMIAQIGNLTIAQGGTRREKAEAALQSRYLIPTTRGRILDRRGRVLAEDQPGYNVAVSWEVITGGWAQRRGLEVAKAANKSRWPELSFDEQDALAAEAARRFEGQADALWEILCDVGGIDRAELELRRDAVRSRVQQMASVIIQRQRKAREEVHEEEVSFGEVARDTKIAEQRAMHEVLTGVDNSTLLRVQRFIAEAQARQQARDPVTDRRVPNDLEVWLSVEPQRGANRVYPLETVPVEIDRSTLPPPLRRDTPLVMNLEGVGTHVVGAMRGVWKKDVDRLPFNKGRDPGSGEPAVDLRGYLTGDRTGAWGVEAAQEARLRGTRGQLRERLDTHEEQITLPAPGKDVTLAVDLYLQARVQAVLDARDPEDPADPGLGLMRVQAWHPKHPERPFGELEPKRGEPLTGAAIVLDVATGDVLAAVSAPALSLRQLRDNPDSVLKDQIGTPFVNRVVSRPLQPGSTVKPVVLAAAYAEHKVGAAECIACTGHFYDNPNAFRCWIYKGFGGATHDELAAPAAIAQSCNIFFFTMGQRLGMRNLTAWYERFGLGRPTGCGLEEDYAGKLPDLSRGDDTRAGFQASDPVLMGIGQGPMLWTPLQAANAYAAIARGGRLLNPRFVLSDDGSPRAGEDLRIDPKGIELVLQGMWDCVNTDKGTAHHISPGGGVRWRMFDAFPGVKLYGKSGTADPGAPLRIDSDGDDRITGNDRAVRMGDHAWCAILAQKQGSARPDYVILVVTEFGGSGGAVSGPIANQVLHAMRAEGYL